MPKISVGEPFSVSLILGTEKIYVSEKGKGVSRFSVEKFLSLSAENFRRGILYCCNIFGYRKNLDKGEGASTTIFRRSFCLTVPKYFNGQHFGVSEELFYPHFSWIAGGASRFRRNFLSHSAETKSFVKEPYFSGNFLVSKKKLRIRGGKSRLSNQIFTSHSAENFPKGIPLFLRNFLFPKVLWMKRGYHVFPFRNKKRVFGGFSHFCAIT